MSAKIGYFIREGIRNVYSNGMMSIASVFIMVCCLMLMGMSFLISENIKNLLRNVEKNNVITAYLKPNVTYDVDYIKNELLAVENVSSCNVYTKEEALKSYEDLLGDSLMELFEGENPLPDAMQITMEDLSRYQETVDKILKIPEVDSVNDRSDMAEKLFNLKSVLKKLGIWAAVGLMSVSVMVISNTIRITMHNRRFEISIMKSIGATNMFIRMPFIIEGVILGLVSSFISIFSLKFIYAKISELISSLIPIMMFSFDKVFYYMFASFIGFGILMGVLSSLLSIKKYLNKEGGMSVVW